MIVLSGDIGGTNTRLQLTQFNKDDSWKALHHQSYPCQDYPSLHDIIKDFLVQGKCSAKDIASVCFAVAGPIIEGQAQFTNLPWFVDEQRLQETFNFKKVKLINDFEANGYGIETLTADDLYVLQAGEPIPHAPKSIIGAGTGLGVALLHWTGQDYHVAATEGGHVDFAPTTEQQMELLNYLQKKFHRVSAERVASGSGIENIYKFVRDNPIFGEQENESLKFIAASGKNVAGAIAVYAHEKQDPIALRTMDIFIRAYASTAGNLALTTLPCSGLYLLGGIAPKMLPQLSDGRFIDVFNHKGRMAHLLEKIPVYVVLNTNIGLQGAAAYAARMERWNDF